MLSWIHGVCVAEAWTYSILPITLVPRKFPRHPIPDHSSLKITTRRQSQQTPWVFPVSCLVFTYFNAAQESGYGNVRTQIVTAPRANLVCRYCDTGSSVSTSVSSALRFPEPRNKVFSSIRHPTRQRECMLSDMAEGGAE